MIHNTYHMILVTGDMLLYTLHARHLSHDTGFTKHNDITVFSCVIVVHNLLYWRKYRYNIVSKRKTKQFTLYMLRDTCYAIHVTYHIKHDMHATWYMLCDTKHGDLWDNWYVWNHRPVAVITIIQASEQVVDRQKIFIIPLYC